MTGNAHLVECCTQVVATTPVLLAHLREITLPVLKCLDGCLLEGGPDTLVLAKRAAPELCARLGLADEIVPYSRGSVEILRGDRLIRVPTGLPMMTPRRLGSLLASCTR